MAIFIHCPSCHQKLADMRQNCPHCGAELPPGVLYALTLALGETPMPPQAMPGRRVPAHVTTSSPSSPPSAPEAQPPSQNSALRPWLAAALSLVCGLGQLYNGQPVKGMVLIVLGTASVVAIQLLLGKILALLVWTYAVVDAYLVAKRMSSPMSVTPKAR